MRPQGGQVVTVPEAAPYPQSQRPERFTAAVRPASDLIEEYARHTGHADLIREAVDGRVGEDPPAEWRPKVGRYRVDG